jgi:hypothetical protein
VGFLSVRRHSSHPTNMFIESRNCVGFYKVSETTTIEYRDLSDKIMCLLPSNYIITSGEMCLT